MSNVFGMINVRGGGGGDVGIRWLVVWQTFSAGGWEKATSKLDQRGVRQTSMHSEGEVKRNGLNMN